MSFLLAPVRSDAALAWFARLWGVAVIAHVVGNPRLGQLWPHPTALGVATAVLGAAAALLVVRPGDHKLLAAVAALTLATVWLEAPFIGNHWLLAGFVSVALLVVLSRPDPWAWFAPTGRWLLLGFYSFAAFAKLNTAFFDPDVSCGLVYANQWLGSAGLGTIAPASPAAWAVVVGTALVELSVPVLLLVPRTRRWGVALGVGFHLLVSFDLGQHFYDFTGVLLPLFGLFLPGMWDAEDEPLRPTARLAVAGLLGLMVLVSVGPVTSVTAWLLLRGAFVLWVPFGLWFAARVLGSMRGRAEVGLRLPGLAAGVLVGLVVLNGLTPYLELKTGYGWNMYANLLTVGGESNHLLVRRTLSLTDEQESPVEILATDDPGLAAYVGSGYALPWSRFRDYLADHPGATVEYRRGSEELRGTGAELGEPLPVLQDKFQLFRAIDLERPVRCQTTWLPAR